MKKLIVILSALLLMIMAFTAYAEYSFYENANLPEYFVCTEYKERNNYILYMYPVSNSQGKPNSYYRNGDVLKVIQLDVNGKNTYSKVIGPDDKEGYVLTRRIVAAGVQDCKNYTEYPKYVVYSTTLGYAYSYPVNSTSKYEAMRRYPNGTTLNIVNWNIDKNFCFVLDDNGQVGYVQKAALVSWDDYYSGNIPTPTPKPTARPTATPSPRPTATPTPRPTATPAPTARTFWNSTGYQLVLTKYNSSTRTYTNVDGTTGYMSALGPNESYRLRLHVTNITGYSVTYTVTATVNGSAFSWNPYTLAGYKSVYHNLGTNLTEGSNYVYMYINGTSLCSGRFNIVNDTYYWGQPTATPTPNYYWGQPTPTPVNYWGNGWGDYYGNVNNTLYGHWLRYDEINSDDMILMSDGTAYWNGQPCTWTMKSGSFTIRNNWTSQTYSYQLNRNELYLTNTGMSLNRALYSWIDTNSEIAGNWTEAGNGELIVFGAEGYATKGNIGYNWATSDNNLLLTSIWGSERYTYTISGNTMILYNAQNPTQIDKVLIRSK